LVFKVSEKLLMAFPMVERYRAEAPRPPEGLDIPEKFGYIHFKSFSYLARGPEAYRAQDAMSMPPEGTSPSTLALLDKGCRQILDWKGIQPDNPLTGLGIDGFYRLIDLFHFKVVQQSALHQNNGAIVDKMKISHVMSGEEITLFNQVNTNNREDGGTEIPKKTVTGMQLFPGLVIVAGVRHPVGCILFTESWLFVLEFSTDAVMASPFKKWVNKLIQPPKKHLQHPEIQKLEPAILSLLEGSNQICAIPLNAGVSAKPLHDGFVFSTTNYPEVTYRGLVHKDHIVACLLNFGVGITSQATNNAEDVISDKEYVITFFKDVGEYMHFLIDLKEMGRAPENASCMAMLTKNSGHYVYKVTKNDSFISERIKPFRANEENIKQFNAGCLECARLLALYLHTRDPKQMPQTKPFGNLTWNENAEVPEPVAGEPIEAPAGKYFPEIRNARVVKRIDAGSHELVLLTDIEVVGVIKYHHMLTVKDKALNEISFLVTSEVGSSHQTGEQNCFLGAFDGSQHVNYGVSRDCVDLAAFEKRACEIAKEKLNLSL
jgi:hypothetical protein